MDRHVSGALLVFWSGVLPLAPDSFAAVSLPVQATVNSGKTPETLVSSRYVHGMAGLGIFGLQMPVLVASLVFRAGWTRVPCLFFPFQDVDGNESAERHLRGVRPICRSLM
jgi:hypothetical protein